MDNLQAMQTNQNKQKESAMITLYHCDAARSFRPLWMLEELNLTYELKMLPFPPRVLAKDYLALNPLGTIPFMKDGETRMTESSGICHYLAMGRHRWWLASMSQPMGRFLTGCISATRH